jgi:energy-coupling factor transport system ATP-binding protein
MLKFDHVCFSYPAYAAGAVSSGVITDVSFEIRRGDFAALIGENGAGKSTLARLCNGLLKPSSGTVRVGGRDTMTVKTSVLARTVGYLFQNPDRQLCQNTVREELLFGLEYSLAGAGLSPAETEAEK